MGTEKGHEKQNNISLHSVLLFSAIDYDLPKHENERFEYNY